VALITFLITLVFKNFIVKFVVILSFLISYTIISKEIVYSNLLKLGSFYA